MITHILPFRLIMSKKKSWFQFGDTWIDCTDQQICVYEQLLAIDMGLVDS